MTTDRRDFTARELEIFAQGSIKYLHVFPENGDTDAAKLRLSQYTESAKHFDDYQYRKIR